MSVVVSSKRQPMNPWLNADLWGTGKLVRGIESSVEGTFVEKKKRSRFWKVCKLCPKGEISMSTLSGKLNWVFKDNAHLRKDYLRLKQTWTEEIGNREILILPSMNPIENSNLKE